MESHVIYPGQDTPPIIVDMFHRTKLATLIDFKTLNCTFGDLKYFLTHFHSDHYGGLGKSWMGCIYTSQITGTLVENILGVNPKYIFKVQLMKSYRLDNFKFTFLNANHCPGRW